jgi:hypothetical protein
MSYPCGKDWLTWINLETGHETTNMGVPRVCGLDYPSSLLRTTKKRTSFWTQFHHRMMWWWWWWRRYDDYLKRNKNHSHSPISGPCYVFPCRMTSYSLYAEWTRLFMVFGFIKRAYCVQGLPANNFCLAHVSSAFCPNFRRRLPF